MASSAVVSGATSLRSAALASEPHESGLGKGAKIGLGIGAALAFVLLCTMLLLGMMCWRERNREVSLTRRDVSESIETREEDAKSVSDVRTKGIRESKRSQQTSPTGPDL